MALRCCTKGASSDAEMEEPLEPQVKNDSRSRQRARHLERHISSHLGAPKSVSTLLDEAYVNVEFLDRQSSCPLSPKPSAERRLLVKLNSIGPKRELTWTHSRKLLEDALQAEQQRSNTAVEEGADLSATCELTEDERLAQRLQKLDLEMLHMAGDGNCQFRSVSNELFDTQDHHPHVRRKAVAHIREHKEEYEGFLGEDFEAYTQQMAQDATWGDELTLRAICDAFSIMVHVVTSEVDHWYLKYEPKDGSSCGREIFLTYIAPIHYNAIRRRSSVAALKQRTCAGFKRLATFSTRASTAGSSRGSRSTSSSQLLSDDDRDMEAPAAAQQPSEEGLRVGVGSAWGPSEQEGLPVTPLVAAR